MNGIHQALLNGQLFTVVRRLEGQRLEGFDERANSHTAGNFAGSAAAHAIANDIDMLFGIVAEAVFVVTAMAADIRGCCKVESKCCSLSHENRPQRQSKATGAS